MLQANREQWAKWSQTDGALKKVRTRLIGIIEGEDSSDKDAIAAAKLLVDYDMGKPTEAKEQLPVQPLVIMLAQADGSSQKLPSRAIEIGVADGVDVRGQDQVPGRPPSSPSIGDVGDFPQAP